MAALLCLYLLFLTLLQDDIELDFEPENEPEQVDVAQLRSRILLLNKAPSLLNLSVSVALPPRDENVNTAATVQAVDTSLTTPARTGSTCSRLACTTPSQLPRPSPGGSASHRNAALYAQYPTRLPLPSSSKRGGPTLSSSMKRRPAAEESSLEMFERKLNAVLDMDAADVFATCPRESISNLASNGAAVHTGYTPVKKAPIALDDEAFAITKKVSFE